MKYVNSFWHENIALFTFSEVLIKKLEKKKSKITVSMKTIKHTRKWLNVILQGYIKWCLAENKPWPNKNLNIISYSLNQGMMFIKCHDMGSDEHWLN